MLLIPFRVLALAVVYFICSAGASAALLGSSMQSSPGDAGAASAALWTISLLNAAVLAHIASRSRWSGWRLTLTVFLVFYGVSTVMPQIETAVFVTRLPPGVLPRLFLAGALTWALVSPLAVLILGKRKPHPAVTAADSRLEMPTREWAARLSLIIVAYITIYFVFGYFIAWKSEAVRAYYAGTDPGTFLLQMRSVVRDTPWLVPLQGLRAVLWTALALPVIRMLRGPWWEAGLAVALLFSVIMCDQLVLPNPFMPREVRMVHLTETASSNFLFGWLVVLLLRGRRSNAAGRPRQSDRMS